MMTPERVEEIREQVKRREWDANELEDGDDVIGECLAEIERLQKQVAECKEELRAEKAANDAMPDWWEGEA